ncbi:ABC transporter ATP-binding protein [Desulfococcus multivorans]|uniref:ABC transporter related protein n=1 Tax=Desulfococcus multivorans DSM 2059 TaxID=1121405 RepID=S7UPR3_DESML|nr:ABC transporter ATP-binding protein [Desulfococcus multivorans]AOY60034.1 putative O-antigen export system ATP-binding protein [Desulfococcus multivorans]EPR36029.1 ABC transporter related protein [Desulfococcus multivorans DSM 2059]SJZ37144.1 lipopolysaccharide transport system ATP-binding protein [Desulfococcus multivorans DSM 2059]
MTEPAIRVDNISKRYRIGLKEKRQDTVGGEILRMLVSPFYNFRKYRSLYRFKGGVADIDFDAEEQASPDILWAVKGVSFQVAPGEVLGLIGRNGAGKSTLLKILARITDPTIGYAEIRGRISSLLEVGTGFHPELTGRDNIFLNGTILGMRRREIEEKFDEIVQFSGVEKFIDTPVKRYSSGMKVRLAFSVAAHLEPELLIIDEVLAVGDADFQAKCLNKMESIGQEGRTVLFVSHNMAAVTRLCTKALLLEGGRIVNSGSASEVVGAYLNSNLGVTSARHWPDVEKAPGNDVVRLRGVRACNENREVLEAFDIRKPIRLEMTFDVYASGRVLMPHFTVKNREGVCAFLTLDQDPEWRKRPRPAGTYVSTALIPGNLLSEGMIYISVNCLSLNPDAVMFSEKNAIAFSVYDNLDGDSARGDYAREIRGVVRPLLKWTTEYRPGGDGMDFSHMAVEG